MAPMSLVLIASTQALSGFVPSAPLAIATRAPTTMPVPSVHVAKKLPAV